MWAVPPIAALLVALAVPLVAKPGSFWQFTDVHFDPGYVAGGNDHNMCHFNASSYNPNVTAFGDYLCDSPLALVMSALKYMQAVEGDPEFIIWTGDDVPHLEAPSYYGPDALTLNSTLAIIRNVTQFLSTAFPNVRVFPSIGNHDWFPPYQVAPGPNPIMDELASYWAQWLSPAALETFRAGGYYSELLHPGLRIVSLNTIFYYHLDRVTVNETDPGGQFAWLNSTLTAARAAKEKVWIISHVPPGYHEKYGTNNMFPNLEDAYLSALSGWSDVIIAQIYGHDHTDSFRFLFDSRTAPQPSGYMLLAPSITPWMSPYYPEGPNNPGVRLYSYNTTSFLLNDYQQFWTNVSANSRNKEITWMPEYTFSSAYDLVPPITTEKLWDLYQYFLTNDTLFQSYAAFNSVLYPLGQCINSCRSTLLCAMTSLYAEEWTPCVSQLSRFR